MDYRSLLTIPLAALALSASSAETLRLPAGWQGHGTPGLAASHAYGVAADTEGQASRALTVQALGQRQPSELGAVWQTVTGYSGKRVRLSAQVKANGVDGWAGLVVREGFLPIFMLAGHPEEQPPSVEVAAPGCKDWCAVSVVADIPADSFGAATVGLALIGNGQVWARDFKLEVVGREVPLTAQRFAAQQTDALRDQFHRSLQARAAQVTPPQNLALH